jgi:hypothetical protein
LFVCKQLSFEKVFSLKSCNTFFFSRGLREIFKPLFTFLTVLTSNEKARKTVVLIPTFNEAKNIEALICESLSTREEIEVLVVDDDFPDMTGF